MPAAGMAATEGKPLFFDMVHSNNAARIRIWMRLKAKSAPELTSLVDTKMVTYTEMGSEEFLRVNPLKKVPAMITSTGNCVFESHVIMQYMEDAYGSMGKGKLEFFL